jgi:hypothetical protein
VDAEILRLKSTIDQTRSEMRFLVKRLHDDIGADGLASIIKTCAAGRLEEFDERIQLAVGMLAVVAIFDLIEIEPEAGAG